MQDYQKYSEELRQKAGLAPASVPEAKTTEDEGEEVKEDEPLVEQAEKVEV
jgi:hypothetical protein